MLYLSDSDVYAKAILCDIREHADRSGETCDTILAHLKRRLDDWASPDLETTESCCAQPNKRARASTPPPAPTPINDAKREIDAHLKSGALKLYQVYVERAPFNHTKQYRPPTRELYDFIVDGSKRTFSFKEKLKLAGYMHYSVTDHSGWIPVDLPEGKKGWGKPTVESM